MKDWHNSFHHNAVEKSTFFYSIDENCRIIALLSILSLLQSAEKESQCIDIKVLCFTNELFDILANDLSILSSKFSSQAEPYLVEPWDTNHIPLYCHRRPLASYGRIIIPRLFDSLQWPVRYLDADTIIKNTPDITEMSENPISAVEESIFSAHRFWYRHKHILLNWYFNAGVILYNIKSFNDNNIENESMSFLQHNPHSNLPDQDALNYACRDWFDKLPASYNLSPLNYTIDTDNIKVLHYAGNTKPWHRNNLPLTYIENLRNLQNDLLNFLEIKDKITIIDPSCNLWSQLKKNISQLLRVNAWVIKNIIRDSKRYDINEIIKYWFYLHYPNLFHKK